ncbi:MAG: prephenate dehydrogenase [Bacillaceae bacterium]
MNIFIAGIGLIGGSLALAIKKHHHVTIVGYDTNEENKKAALRLRVVDEIASSFEQGAKEADIIILASPVASICRLIDTLSSLSLKKDVIITDVGSTKTKIMEAARSLNDKGISFIGAHPMAGSHKSGVLAAKVQLFENAYYILTPFANEKEGNIEKLKALLACTNAYLVVLDHHEHDKITGMISHFPHLIAASLVRHANRFSDEYPLATAMAAGGFRDITRIASSSPEMWRDVIANNQENMLQFLDEWLQEMEDVKEIVAQGNSQVLFDYFSSAKRYRDSLLIRQSGAIPAFYDLFVDIIDDSGAIASVTAIVAKANINIKNLGIIESREGLLGVFRISFRTEEDRERAKVLLEDRGYDIYLKL